jgi:hypothetical protein
MERVERQARQARQARHTIVIFFTIGNNMTIACQVCLACPN